MPDWVSKVKPSDEQETPPEFYQGLNEWFGPFDLDVCASHENHKCDNYFTIDDNALEQAWTGKCWMNYPYSQPYPWLEKAYNEALHGAYVIVLGKFDCSTKWWNEWVRKCSKWWLVSKRLKFNGVSGSPNFLLYVAEFNKVTLGEAHFSGYFNDQGQRDYGRKS